MIFLKSVLPVVFLMACSRGYCFMLNSEILSVTTIKGGTVGVSVSFKRFVPVSVKKRDVIPLYHRAGSCLCGEGAADFFCCTVRSFPDRDIINF